MRRTATAAGGGTAATDRPRPPPTWNGRTSCTTAPTTAPTISPTAGTSCSPPSATTAAGWSRRAGWSPTAPPSASGPRPTPTRPSASGATPGAGRPLRLPRAPDRSPGPGPRAVCDADATARYRISLLNKYGMSALIALARSRLRLGLAGTVGIRITINELEPRLIGPEWPPPTTYCPN
ncbi:hypothetical protein ACFQ0M_13875 [Kitasatospora aburaviensis]